MSDILALAQEVEATTISGYDLDRDVALACGWKCDALDWRFQERWLRPDGALFNKLPRFIVSVDAAMMLVPKGMKFILDSHHMLATIYDYWPVSSPEDDGFASYQGEAANLALALTAAALRAIAAATGTARTPQVVECAAAQSGLAEASPDLGTPPSTVEQIL